jgi:hypothetical protein
MAWSGKRKFIYTDNKGGSNNQVAKHASAMLRRQGVNNDDISMDYDEILKGGCTYLPNFFEKTNDTIIFGKIRGEINLLESVNWSKHFKYENPEFSETFNYIVREMAKYFNVDVIQTRLNYYRDGRDYKPFHKDRHSYGDGENNIREDFTMGASFGASRHIEFIHDKTQNKFEFPQNNGDIFAFNSEINKKFKHGVPKVVKRIGERISIIAWGIQR